MAKKSIVAALAKISKRLPIDEVRAALEDRAPKGRHFLAQTALSGPWSLVALVLNPGAEGGTNLISKPILSGSDRTITFDLSDVDTPFGITWAIFYGMDQPKTTVYVVDDGRVTKLTEKAKATAATVWSAGIFTYPKGDA